MTGTILAQCLFVVSLNRKAQCQLPLFNDLVLLCQAFVTKKLTDESPSPTPIPTPKFCVKKSEQIFVLSRFGGDVSQAA